MESSANKSRTIRFGDGDLELDTVIEEITGNDRREDIVETTLFFSRNGTSYALQISRQIEEHGDPTDPQEYDGIGLTVPFIDPRLVVQVMGLPTERILELAVVIPTEE